MLPIPVQDAFDRLACDIIGPFPPSKLGNRYVVVFSEYLTKWVEAFPVSSIEASVIAHLLVDEIFARHGAPRTLLSDRGSNSLYSIVTEVCHLLNAKKRSILRPTTLRRMGLLNVSTTPSQKLYHLDWDIYIAAISFAYRTSPCVSTGDTPFYLLYGRQPRLAPDVSLLPPCQLSSSVEEHRARIVSQLETAQSMTRSNTARTQQLIKLQYDKNSADPQFEIGQRVWIYTPRAKRGLSKKLLSKWNGPFRICRKFSPVHHQVRTCDNRLVATTVHANRLKHFYNPADRPILPPAEDNLDDLPFDTTVLPADSRESEDPKTTNDANAVPDKDVSTSVNSTPVDSPDLLNEPDVHRTEKILKSRRRNGKIQYLVKWSNYPSSENTWEPEENILDLRLLEEFDKKSK